ncbi:hypothetical protein SADUNF_Sadunf12G0093800 [Salix dunnii]|uniref:FRIGIDA-like protein n=1 Tax=Salix dunnii TaxID=1413687 RepID=A0A835JNV5_9ROSI|nr:hypothetical protein SADUNF_Sadunf12G0093800 [Salix dunnii]
MSSVRGFAGGSTLHCNSCGMSLLRSSVLKNIKSFIEFNDEIPFAKLIPRGKSISLRSNSIPMDLDELDSRGLHIPRWLPRQNHNLAAPINEESKSIEFKKHRKVSTAEPSAVPYDGQCESPTIDGQPPDVMAAENGLHKSISDNRKNLTVLKEEIPLALKSAVNPAQLVLNSLEDFYPEKVSYVDGKKDSTLLGLRRTCIMLMECLGILLMYTDLVSASNLVSEDVKGQAKAIAEEWMPKLDSLDVDANNGNSLEAHAFLQLLATFGIASGFDEEELSRLIPMVSRRRQAAEVCRFLGLTERMPGLRGFPQSPGLLAKLSLVKILELKELGIGPDKRLLATLKFFKRPRNPICPGIWPVNWLWSSLRTFRKEQFARLDGISPEKLLEERSRDVAKTIISEIFCGIDPKSSLLERSMPVMEVQFVRPRGNLPLRPISESRIFKTLFSLGCQHSTPRKVQRDPSVTFSKFHVEFK